MKTIIVVILIVLILIGSGLYFGYSANNSDNSNLDAENSNNKGINQDTSKEIYNINIQDFSYSPIEIKIKKGDTIAWANKDSVSHTITSDSGNELDSELLSEGKIYSHTFNVAGTYNYHCTPHPFMKGRIIVE